MWNLKVTCLPQSQRPRDSSATPLQPLLVRENVYFQTGWWVVPQDFSHLFGEIGPKEGAVSKAPCECLVCQQITAVSCSLHGKCGAIQNIYLFEIKNSPLEMCCFFSRKSEFLLGRWTTTRVQRSPFKGQNLWCPSWFSHFFDINQNWAKATNKSFKSQMKSCMFMCKSRRLVQVIGMVNSWWM